MTKPKPVPEKPPKQDEVESDSDDESDDEDYAPDGNNQPSHASVPRLCFEQVNFLIN